MDTNGLNAYLSRTDDLTWSHDTFSLPHLIEHVEFPQLLKLVDNFKRNCKPDSTLFPQGEIVKLHGVKTLKKAVLIDKGSSPHSSSSCEQVADEYGPITRQVAPCSVRKLMVPIGYSRTLQILPYRHPEYQYETAGDLVKEKPRPSAVIVGKKICLHEKHCVIQAGDVLAITSVDKRCTNNGVVDFLICKHNDKTIGLPMSCVGKFTVHREETLYNLKDFVSRRIELPQKIQFCDSLPPNPTQCKTIARGGERMIVPDREYIVESIQTHQYLVCTLCNSQSSVSAAKVFFIPVTHPAAKQLKVRLPLFHDIRSYQQTLNERFCTNLSMKNVLDPSPIEFSGYQDILVNKLGEVYDFGGPELPPRSQRETDHGRYFLIEV